LARYGSLSRGATVPIPSQFQETIERKADYFETLLGILTVLARVKDPETPDLPFWLPRTSHHREGPRPSSPARAISDEPARGSTRRPTALAISGTALA